MIEKCPACGQKLPSDVLVLGNSILLYTAKDLVNIAEMSQGVSAHFSGVLAQSIENCLGYIPFSIIPNFVSQRNIFGSKQKSKKSCWVRLSLNPVPEADDFIDKSTHCTICRNPLISKAYQLMMGFFVEDLEIVDKELDTHRFAEMITPEILSFMGHLNFNHTITHRTPIDFNIFIKERSHEE